LMSSSCQANQLPLSAKKRHNGAPTAAHTQEPALPELGPGARICAMATCSTAALQNFLLSAGAGAAICSSSSAPASASCSPCKPPPVCARNNLTAASTTKTNTAATAGSSASSGASADSSESPTPELLLSDEEAESKSQPGAADDACRCRSCRSRRAAQRVRRGLDRPKLQPEAEARLTALADWLAERDPGALYSAAEELGRQLAREAGARLAEALKKLAPTGEYNRDCCRSMTRILREEYERMRKDATRQAAVLKSLDTAHLTQCGLSWQFMCEHWFQSLAYGCAELRQLQNIMMERLKPRPEDRETPSPMKLYLELDANMSEAESRWRLVRPRLQNWRAQHCAVGFSGLAEELAGTLLTDESVVQQLYKLHVQSSSETPAQTYTCTKCNKTLCGCYMCSFTHCVTCGFEEAGGGGDGAGSSSGGGRRRKRHSDVELRGCCSSGEEEAADAAGDSADAHRRKTDIAAALVSSSLCKSTSATDAAVVSSNSKGGGGGSGCCAFYSEAEEFIKGSSGGRCQHQHLLLDAAQYPQNYQVPQHQHSHHQPAASDADKATGDSTTGNENGRFCDCCYCEVFGHSGGQQPAVPPKFFEKREQLRSKLLRKKQQSKQGQQKHQQQQQPEPPNDAAGVGGGVGAICQSSSTDIDALVEFIEGAKAGKERAAKREVKKTRQKAARKAAEPAATSPAAGRQRQQQQRQRDVENQTPVRGGKLQDAADPNSGNGRSANGDRQRMLGRQELEGLNRRDDLDDDQLFDDDDVDPVVEQFKSFVMNCQTPKERQKVRLDLDSLSMLMKK
ncbi:hypothetical protein BOX15_Mlig024194g1, partial [Macrostomum lignano]